MKKILFGIILGMGMLYVYQNHEIIESNGDTFFYVGKTPMKDSLGFYVPVGDKKYHFTFNYPWSEPQ